MAIRVYDVFHGGDFRTRKHIPHRRLAICKQAGHLRPTLNIVMIPGFLLDRLGNQILHASLLDKNVEENIIGNLKYRNFWLSENIDILLFGLVTSPAH